MLLSRPVLGLGRQLVFQSSSTLGDEINGNCFIKRHPSVRLSSSVTMGHVKSLDDVPSISMIPYVGTLRHYIKTLGGEDPIKIHELSVKRFHEFGPIYKEDLRILRADGKYAIWLYDADDVEKVYRSGGKYPVRGGFDPLGVYRKTRTDVYKALGLLILNGTDWHSFRSKVQPVLLQPRIMNNYSSAISSIADEMISEIRRVRDCQTMVIGDLTAELYRYTLESVAYVGLDTRLNCLSNFGPTQKRIVDAVSEMFKLEAHLNEAAFWRIIGRPVGSKWTRFIEINNQFTEMVYDFVKEKLQQIIKNPIKGPDEDRSALELFLTRPNCTPEDAVTMVMDMFFAGIDTTAHLIVFTLHYLANNPDIQERVYEEVIQLSNGTGQLDSDSLTQLTLLKACIKETSRLTPVAPISMRINQEPIVLSGYEIPSKCFLVLNHYAMSRLPEYFDEPMKFNPDRWVREIRGDNKAHPFVVLPFGHGPRMCIGRRIAELETLTLLSKIVYNFKTLAVRSELPTSTMVISYPDNPMTFSLTDRHP